MLTAPLLLLAALSVPPPSLAEKPYVLVAFAGDRQVGFIQPSEIRIDGHVRTYSVLWIYTPPQPDGARIVHRALWRSEADCARGTMRRRSAAFYGEGEAALDDETFSDAEEERVLPSSPGADVHRFVCNSEEPYPEIRLSRDERDATILANELAAFYRANPTR